MLYKIDNDYFIYRNRSYIKVMAELKDGEVDLKPDTSVVFEDNNIESTQITIQDIKKELESKREYDRDDSKSRYSR